MTGLGTSKAARVRMSSDQRGAESVARPPVLAGLMMVSKCSEPLCHCSLARPGLESPLPVLLLLSAGFT